MKKLLSMLLLVCMLCSCLTVFAESKAAEQKFSTENLEGEVIIPFSEAVGKENYKSSKVVKGYDGGDHYWGSEAVTYEFKNMKAGKGGDMFVRKTIKEINKMFE